MVHRLPERRVKMVWPLLVEFRLRLERNQILMSFEQEMGWLI